MTLRTTMTWLEFRRSTLGRGSACLLAAVLAAGSTVAGAAHVGKVEAMTDPVEALKQPDQSTRKASADGLAGLPPFGSARAFADLKHLVSFGPRPTGSEALEKSRQWIVSRLSEGGLKVDEERFVAATPIGNLGMANLIVRLPGSPESHVEKRRLTCFVSYK